MSVPRARSFHRLAAARPLLLKPSMSDGKGLLQVAQIDGVWVVRVERPGGKHQEYRCATEAQARALVVALQRPAA